MADGAVNFLLDKITTILMQNASLLGDAGEEMEKIKLELESIRSFLRDAEGRKQMSESVETWVGQVREVAYEAEDIVDEFMHYRFKEPVNNRFKSVVQDVINFPKNITARHQIHSKLQKIKEKVFEVSERSKRYGFAPDFDEKGKTRNVGVVGDRWQQYGESSTFIDEDEIVGMEEDTEKLLGWLTEEESRRTIVSVVGMGGLGKTTLVTRVYKNQIIKRVFDCWGWISVSQTYGMGELLRSMIKEILDSAKVAIPSNLGSMNYRQLMEMLIDCLHQKRYIIVLDDVWSIELWSMIRGAFPNNKCGSRIILTTRHENVASSVGIGSRVHRLQPLEEKDAWALFCRKAFWNDPEHVCPNELQPLAEAILKKCEGLPLAIVAVGGLMCSRSNRAAEWKSVYESINWQISHNPMLERVKGILLLSFKDLPYYLKHCFLYCCVFRDGYPIKRKRLIRLWVAEGFIIERKGMRMEEIAEEYLTELILRNMIQITETNEAGRVKLCRVHDVMRELALTTSEKENFCTTFDGYQSRLEEKIHRLSIYSVGDNLQISGTILRHLRSFFVFPTDMCLSFSLKPVITKFKLLKVLNLEGVPIETMPTTLIELFNLRYLNLRHTKIKELPKSIGRLYNLQTLDVWKTNIERLPSGISQLSKLRHLFMCRRNDQKYDNILRGMQAPDGIWNIRSLQTLASIEAEKVLLQQVGNLNDLKRLEITKLRADDGTKLCASIQRMTGLCRLTVMANTTQELLKLEALHLPPLFLQKLKLVGKLNRLPPWLGSLTSLTHLYLSFSSLEEDILSSICLLPNLAFLELKKAYKGDCLHFRAGSFPKLNKMVLLQLARLNSLTLDVGSLASIQELHLVGCQELNMLPHGIEHLSSLQKLHLEETADEFVQRLATGANESIEKVRHIPIITLALVSGETRIVETL